MSAPERTVHSRISGHTNGNGGRVDLRTEPSLGVAAADHRSITDLFRELSSESGDLVRKEVELAKAELNEKMSIFGRGVVSMGIGGALLLCALLTGLWALNGGLTALLAQFLALDIAVWLSPLILTLCLGIGGWMMISGAKERMAREGLSMRRTRETLMADKRWAQAKVTEVKEEVTHVR